MEKAKGSRIWKRKGSRSQGFEGSRGERQKTGDRRQEMIVIHSNSWLFIGRREGDKILNSEF